MKLFNMFKKDTQKEMKERNKKDNVESNIEDNKQEPINTEEKREEALLSLKDMTLSSEALYEKDVMEDIIKKAGKDSSTLEEYDVDIISCINNAFSRFDDGDLIFLKEDVNFLRLVKKMDKKAREYVKENGKGAIGYLKLDESYKEILEDRRLKDRG